MYFSGSVPAPRVSEDEEGCRAFVFDFLRCLPSLSNALSERRSDVLVAYVRKGLLASQEFASTHSMNIEGCEALLADCLVFLRNDKPELFMQAAQALARDATSVCEADAGGGGAAFGGNGGSERLSLPALLSFGSMLLGVIAVVLVGIGMDSALHAAAVALMCFSVVFCLASTRSLMSACTTHKANTELQTSMIHDLVVSSMKMVANPLVPPLSQQQSAVVHVDDDTVHPHAAASFLIEQSEALRRKGQIDAILMETDVDDGQIVVRTKNSVKVSVSIAALNKHLMLVITDLDGKVIFWNEGAVGICGFSARDTEGKDISSFLFGDSTIQLYEKMTDAAVNGVDASHSAKLLTLANITYGSVAVRASVVLAKSQSSDEPVGFVLLASPQESDSARSVSLFHQYFVNELAQMIPQKGDDPRRRLVEFLHWKNLQDLATSSRDWSSVLLQAVLNEVVKDRHRQCDVRVMPNVAELIICDQGAVIRAMLLSLQLLAGKIRIQVSQKRCTDAVHQLVIQCHHNSEPNPDAIDDTRRAISEIGCELSTGEGMLRLHVPILSEGGTGPAESLRPKDAQSAPKVTTAPMTILLLEKNAVYRHNLSTIAWASGHSLRVVDSVAKALKAVNDSASSDLGCAVIDVDVRDVDKLLDALERHKIFTIATSETADSPYKGSTSFLVKPTTRVLLEVEIERAAQSIRERKKVDEEILKQREIFGKVRNSPWVRGKKLGRGAFADVFEATSTLTGGKMAVKMIRLVGGFKEKVKELLNEIEILCSLVHPNIIHYFYCERAELTINLFMELADEGSLQDLLSRQGGRMPEDQLAVVTKQLLLAVNYLHDQNIIHRDIKPGNMLISKGKVKLSDFGTATNTSGEGTQGTIFYMAPEVVDGHQYGKECDIWSIGCVLCECLGIKRPSRMNGLLGFGVPTTFPMEISPSAKDFITLCLQEDASERPTAGSLLLHDFIVGARQDMSQIGRAPDVAPSAAATAAAVGSWGAGGATGGGGGGDLSVSSGGSTPSW